MLDFVKDTNHNVTDDLSWGNCGNNTFTTTVTSKYATGFGTSWHSVHTQAIQSLMVLH